MKKPDYCENCGIKLFEVCAFCVICGQPRDEDNILEMPEAHINPEVLDVTHLFDNDGSKKVSKMNDDQKYQTQIKMEKSIYENILLQIIGTGLAVAIIAIAMISHFIGLEEFLHYLAAMVQVLTEAIN